MRSVVEMGRVPAETAMVDRAGERAASGRWLALDMFRFAAVCLMVQGHVFSTLLDPATKAQGWYPHHTFVHGYTAPMFLFGAGLAFGYTTFRGWDAHTKSAGASLKRVKRYAWLLAIGYALHLPTLSLTRLLALDNPVRIASFLQVDVLQHIAVSLLFCQLLVIVCRRKRVFVGVVAVLAALAVLAAPWVWNLDLRESGVPLWLAGYINASTGSVFPILPWAGFSYLGIVAAYAVHLAPRTRSISHAVRWPFAALALLFIVVPIVLDRFALWPWPAHNFWKTNPLFFCWRLGNVIAVLALLCFAERAIERLGWLALAVRERAGRVVKYSLGCVELIGAESLVIYVVHLVLLHGSVLGRGLKRTELLYEGRQDLPTAIAVAVLLLLAMILLAKAWSELRKLRFSFGAVQLSLTSAFAYLMLTAR